MLVEFRSSVDPEYPERLAERIMELRGRGIPFSPRLDCVALAHEHFDYDVLAGRLARVLTEIHGRAGRPRSCATRTS
jgi:hypothetical protein